MTVTAPMAPIMEQGVVNTEEEDEGRAEWHFAITIDTELISDQLKDIDASLLATPKSAADLSAWGRMFSDSVLSDADWEKVRLTHGGAEFTGVDAKLCFTQDVLALVSSEGNISLKGAAAAYMVMQAMWLGWSASVLPKDAPERDRSAFKALRDEYKGISMSDAAAMVGDMQSHYKRSLSVSYLVGAPAAKEAFAKEVGLTREERKALEEAAEMKKDAFNVWKGKLNSKDYPFDSIVQKVAKKYYPEAKAEETVPELTEAEFLRMMKREGLHMERVEMAKETKERGHPTSSILPPPPVPTAAMAFIKSVVGRPKETGEDDPVTALKGKIPNEELSALGSIGKENISDMTTSGTSTPGRHNGGAGGMHVARLDIEFKKSAGNEEVEAIRRALPHLTGLTELHMRGGEALINPALWDGILNKSITQLHISTDTAAGLDKAIFNNGKSPEFSKVSKRIFSSLPSLRDVFIDDLTQYDGNANLVEKKREPKENGRITNDATSLFYSLGEERPQTSPKGHFG